MKILCRFWIVLLALSLNKPCWGAKPQPSPDLSPSNPEIPFKLYAGYLIIVEGRIANHSKLKFVLDTGVTHSVVDRKLATRISATHSSGNVLNFDKNVPAEWAEVSQVQLGPIVARNISMMVSDLRYFQSFATRVDAVIGLDLLRLSSFSINYGKQKISFGRVAAASGVPLNSTPVCLTAQLKAGDILLRLIVDSGVQAVVLYEDNVVSRIPQLRMRGEVEGTSMGGYVHSKRAVMPTLRLGDTDLKGTVFLVKAPPGRVTQGIDGYLGIAALKARRVDFDFENNTLAWRR